MRKIIDGVAIFSGVGVLAIIGSGAYAYFWLTSNQDKLINDAVQSAIGGAMPTMSGPAVQAPRSTGGISIPGN
mgnify:CR=1 FL=1